MHEETNPTTTELKETNPSIIAEVPPENPELQNAADVGAAENLATLTDDERDSYLSIYKGMAEDSVAALPPDMRREYFAIKEKISASAEKTPEPAAEVVENENITSPGAEEEKEEEEKNTSADSESQELSDAEKIKMLEEELRKSNARYSSLQGKYNAEIVKKKKNISPHIPSAAEKENADTSDDPETGIVSYSTNDDEAFAESHGLDVDVVRAIRELSEMQNADLRDKMSALSDAQRNAILDREIRETTGGMSIDEVGSHPLFSRYASQMKDANGVTAAEAIDAAKKDGNLREVAEIAAQIVREMQAQGTWYLSNRTGYSAAKSSEPAAVNKDAGNSVDSATKNVAVKVSSATPHSTGGVPSAQTARTVDVVEAELDAALSAFRRDKSLAPKIHQLTRELSQLEKQSRI